MFSFIYMQIYNKIRIYRGKIPAIGTRNMITISLTGDKSCWALMHALAFVVVDLVQFCMCCGSVGRSELWHYLRAMCRLGQLWSNVLSSTILAELYRNKFSSITQPRQKERDLACIHTSPWCCFHLLRHCSLLWHPACCMRQQHLLMNTFGTFYIWV